MITVNEGHDVGRARPCDASHVEVRKGALCAEGWGSLQRAQSTAPGVCEMKLETHLDLCGCVRFPGSSKVHAELDVRQDWQGWPSSHLMRRRLRRGRQQHGRAQSRADCAHRQRSHALYPAPARSPSVSVCPRAPVVRNDSPAQLEPSLFQD